MRRRHAQESNPLPANPDWLDAGRLVGRHQEYNAKDQRFAEHRLEDMAAIALVSSLVPLIASFFIISVESFLGDATVHVVTHSQHRRHRQQACTILRVDVNDNNNDMPGAKQGKSPRRLVIPLVGPIPNAPPLLVGSEMLLSPPTPGQWRSLQEAVAIHRNALALAAEEDQQQQQETTSPVEGGTIDAAPLVAVIDGVTGSTAGARYSTLAAVVGISSKDWSASDGEESFWDSIMAPSSCGDMIRPFSSTVRLVGVGRAKLGGFFYRTPTTCSLPDGSGGHDITALDEETGSYSLGQEEDWDDDDYDDGYEPPIIMAKFNPLVDGPADSRADPKTLGNKGSRSIYRSPVHAINELNSMLNRVRDLHNDRRRLVNGITAAKARLDARKLIDAGEEAAGSNMIYDDFEELGWVGSTQSDAQEKVGEQISVGDFLSSFQQRSQTTMDPLAQLARAEEEQKAIKFLEGLDNLGLAYFGYFSAIPDLTEQALKLFVPYYSAEHRSREEHDFEIASFVALRTVEGYASPTEVGWALQSTSTIERLQATYDIMADHRIQLEKMAEHLSHQLLDCGEECDDLW